jgi:hypothetical protein
MAAENVIFIGWHRPVPGYEKFSVQEFGKAMEWIVGQQQSGRIASFEPVLLEPHGGDLNGMIIIKGEADQLNSLIEDPVWQELTLKASWYMQGFGFVRGVTGGLLGKRMMAWQNLPSKV